MAKNNIMRAMTVNSNSKVAAGQLNNKLKLTIKPYKAERSFQVIIICGVFNMSEPFHIVFTLTLDTLLL